MMVEFRNESGLEFIDISSEEWREYTFAHGITARVAAVRLNVSKSGGHRLFDAAGNSHYIPAGWVKLTWRARDGEPHFIG